MGVQDNIYPSPTKRLEKKKKRQKETGLQVSRDFLWSDAWRVSFFLYQKEERTCPRQHLSKPNQKAWKLAGQQENSYEASDMSVRKKGSPGKGCPLLPSSFFIAAVNLLSKRWWPIRISPEIKRYNLNTCWFLFSSLLNFTNSCFLSPANHIAGHEFTYILPPRNKRNHTAAVRLT